MISEKHKNVFVTLNYIEHFFNSARTVTGCISISTFASLIDISIAIMSSTVALEIVTGIKNYKSIIKEKKKKHDKIIFLVKSKLNSTKALISKTLIDSNISHDEFF